MTVMRFKILTFLLSIFCLTPIIGICSETSNFSVTLSQGLELDITKFSANGSDLLLFIYPTSGKGIESHHETMAQELANAHTEVWLADITDALFLPHSSSTIRKLTGEYLADLIVKAHSETGKNIYIAGITFIISLFVMGSIQLAFVPESQLQWQLLTHHLRLAPQLNQSIETAENH